MTRYFAPITQDELKVKIGASRDTLKEALGSDLKVSFDFENFSADKEQEADSLMGYQTLPNGLTFCGMWAGGDWELPVFFIVYWDGKRLRGYVPTDGNNWNTATKKAYGNDEEADFKNAKKRWPDIYDMDEEDFSADCMDNEFDFQAIKEEILDRIQSKGAPQVSKPKASGKQSLQKRIECLIFYGTGDEAFELFEKACSFCYALNGLGETDKAETVCGWAEEMAAFSKEWWEREMPGEKPSIAHGLWGY